MTRWGDIVTSAVFLTAAVGSVSFLAAEILGQEWGVFSFYFVGLSLLIGLATRRVTVFFGSREDEEPQHDSPRAQEVFDPWP